MKNVIRLTTRLSRAMLLTTLLASCGAATTPASNGPAPTAQQAAGLEQTMPSPDPATMASIATMAPTDEPEPTQTPSPTMAPTDEPEPTQTPSPTNSPVAPSTVPTPSATVLAPTPTEQAQQPAPVVAVQADIKLFQYQPDPLEIALGTTVAWTNKDAAPHTVTHGTYVKRGGAFDSGTLKQGQSFAFTFERAGSYTYTCLIHPEMVGTVKVVGP